MSNFKLGDFIKGLPAKEQKPFHEFLKLYYEKLQYQGAFLLSVRFSDLTVKARYKILADALDLWKKSRPNRQKKV